MLLGVRLDPNDYAFIARFDDEDDVVLLQLPGPNEHRLDFDGRELSRSVPDLDCRQAGADSEVNGRRYGGLACGVVSPNGRWMTYRVDAGDTEITPGYRVPVWDQWVIDLSTDQRRLLQAGLRHCGGCDGRFGPEWSASSRYVFYSELVDKVFLSDMTTGTTREITPGTFGSDLAKKPSGHRSPTYWRGHPRVAPRYWMIRHLAALPISAS